MLFALQRRPQPLVGEVLYDPLGDQEIGELGQAPPGERQPVLSRRGLGELLDLPPLAQRELRQMPPAYLGYSESRPSALKLRSTSRTRSSLVNAGRAICATLIVLEGHRLGFTSPSAGALPWLRAIAPAWLRLVT